MAEHHLIAAIATSMLGIPLLGLLLLRQWYSNLVLSAQAQVRHQDGRLVPSVSRTVGR